MAVLTCKDLCFAYDGSTVLEGVNFSLNAGNYLCIVGENGSGKTTLMKGLLGLKQPDAGSIEFGEGLKSTEIGYLPQQTQLQRDFPASVWEVVLSGCLNSLGRRLHYNDEDKKRAAFNLERMGIEDLRDKSYQTLSGGQQQRVLLARALCATKKMLLLDEPVTGLDPIATGELYNLIKLVNLCDDLTVVMVSHDVDCAIERAKKILHLRTVPLFFGNSGDYRMSEIGRSFMAGRPEKGGEDA